MGGQSRLVVSTTVIPLELEAFLVYVHKSFNVYSRDWRPAEITLGGAHVLTVRILGTYWLVTVRIGNFIVLPHCETRPLAPWSDFTSGHFTLVLS